MSADDIPDRLLDEHDARQALGNLGRSKLFELTASGEIRSVKIGRRRMWPTSAINEYIAGLVDSQ